MNRSVFRLAAAFALVVTFGLFSTPTQAQPDGPVCTFDLPGAIAVCHLTPDITKTYCYLRASCIRDAKRKACRCAHYTWSNGTLLIGSGLAPCEDAADDAFITALRACDDKYSPRAEPDCGEGDGPHER